MASFISSFAREWRPTSFLVKVQNSLTFLQSSIHQSAYNGLLQSISPSSSSKSLPSMSEPLSPSYSSLAPEASLLDPLPEMDALKRIFDHFDENKDGKISREELRRSLKMFGMETDDTELVAMIESADWNSDGFIDLSEFTSFYYQLNEEFGLKKEDGDNPTKSEDSNIECSTDTVGISPEECNEPSEEADLRDAFKLFDKNGDGFISAEELQSVLRSMGLSQGKLLSDCRNMICSADVDGDGRVSFDEFKQMMLVGFGQS